MGEATYRWERRTKRSRLASERRHQDDLWIFQTILLIFIFAFWLIGARLLIIFAVIQLPCAELVADFGASAYGKPVFQSLLYLSIMLAVFWGVVGAVYRTIIFKKWHMIFHIVILLLIMMLSASFYSMTLADNNPPDGTLRVEHGFSMTPQTGEWMLGDSDIAIERECVWIDRGVITTTRNLTTDTHLGVIKIDFSNPWYSLRDVKDHQDYRPLTDAERIRFYTQQACMKDLTKNRQQCEYGWVFNKAYRNGDLSTIKR